METLKDAMAAEAKARRASVEAAAESYRDSIRNQRMAAITLDEIRKLAVGARTQPLRDLGVSSLLDCHSWDASRFMVLRGIGPDSGHKLAAACAVLKKTVHEKPIPHPAPSASDLGAHAVFESIHEQLRSHDLLAAPKKQLDAIRDAVLVRCRAVEEGTAFGPWLFGSARKGKLKECVEAGRALLCDEMILRTMDLARGALAEAQSTRALVKFDAASEVSKRPEYAMTFEQLFGAVAAPAQRVPSNIAEPRPPKTFAAAPPPLEPVLVRARRPIQEYSSGSSGFQIQISIGCKSDHVTGIAPAACWLGFGEVTTIHGKRIRGPVYVGRGLQAASRSTVEPALIDPSLPVASVGDYRVRMLEYWANYSHATPEARSSYLAWLADGKKDPDADVGYAFLYFYGLERRALADESTAAQGDIPSIVAEVERLRGIYGRSRSFAGYSSEFLNYLAASRAESSLAELPALTRYSLPFSLRLRLGQLAAAQQPLPAVWAHAWHHCDPRTRLPAAAERCPELAKQLFELRYRERFGAGISLPGSRTRIKITYRPASASFGSTFVHALDLPDVTVMTSVYTKIDELAAGCFKELDPHSRYIWRNRDGGGSAEARLLLPPALWPVAAREAIEAHLKSGAEKTPTLKVVLALFGSVDRLTRPQYRLLTSGLAAVGAGIEPDLRFTNDVPDLDDPVALFSCANGEALGPGFPTASLIVQLAAAAATADGEFSDEEARKLRQEIARMPDLTADGQRRLDARVSTYRVRPPGITRLKAAVAPLDRETRENVAEVVLGVVSGTGMIEPSEVKVLEKIFALIGLEAGTLYGRLHGLAANPAGDGPDVCQKTTGPLQLDVVKIARLKAASDEVTKKLAAIFVEDPIAAEPPPEEPPGPEIGAANPLGLALDRAHSELLTLIVTRAQWTRAEFEEICADKGLMPDGAIESINDAAFETFSQPLIEGEDPLEISLHLEKAAAA